ncbi:cation antiporter [Caenispirillum salinarum AK4]|uniref:Cation antiporter n=1 Tax=Caenispirillum salinarum AK4 TaxID=1238182 RepID=K9HR43_9PROT|nr:Na+/H+ antiporter subunit E [Caenispirillum salinarum]EKV30901.1 cation antiporter [Caenispirillum salinarum AK4]
MFHAVGLGLVMYLLWLVLSGHYTGLLMTLGAISCAFIVWIVHRMDAIDHEAFPVHLSLRGTVFWPWLLWEIVKSNVDVAKIILDPRLPISPTVVRVPASQKTEFGRVIFANSITLTPGTMSVHMEDHTIVVHALTRSGADGLLNDDEMDRRVCKLEGSC